ncbi:T9SS type A sorting domain-containing protein [Soonwooa sp.]|uniref:T9SS type A sorting domain-containing protein n=1 Tax=Soonwooa sp. TaxID=1938592 RepID=UPI00261AA089|nr:T9SS type A sorting domain-containing protein [Soonwooa sp.]
MKKNYKRIFQVLAVSLFGTLTNAQLYIIGEGYQPMNVSANGTVVGNKSSKTIWMWTPNQQPSVIGQVTTGSFSGNVSISEDGNTIASSMTNPQSNLNEMAIYNKTSSTWNFLGGLAANQDAFKSSVWGMSPDGKTIVGNGYQVTAYSSAATWTAETGVTAVANPLPGKNDRANTISADKSTIVGWHEVATGERSPAFWRNGAVTAITNSNGQPIGGEARAASSNGNIIVGISGVNSFVYDNGVYQEISNPKYTDMYFSGASGITRDGKKVIGFFRPSSGSPYGGDGYMWTKENGLVDLNAYVSSLGVDLGNYTLALPLAISGDGTKIVGVARTPDFKTYGFMVDLTTYLAASNTTTKSAVKIYPNPVKDVLSIANSKSIKSVELINMAGQKVASATSNQINVANLPKGTYVVKVVDGNQTTTHKIVKE